jgi:hypothetical protein
MIGLVGGQRPLIDWGCIWIDGDNHHCGAPKCPGSIFCQQHLQGLQQRVATLEANEQLMAALRAVARL